MAKTLRNKLRKTLRKTKTPKHKNNKHAKTKRAYAKRRQMKGGYTLIGPHGNFDLNDLNNISLNNEVLAIQVPSMKKLCHKAADAKYETEKAREEKKWEEYPWFKGSAIAQSNMIKDIIDHLKYLKDTYPGLFGEYKEINQELKDKLNDDLKKLYDRITKVNGGKYYILPGNIILKRKYKLKLLDGSPEVQICRWNKDNDRLESTTIQVTSEIRLKNLVTNAYKA